MPHDVVGTGVHNHLPALLLVPDDRRGEGVLGHADMHEPNPAIHRARSNDETTAFGFPIKCSRNTSNPMKTN